MSIALSAIARLEAQLDDLLARKRQTAETVREIRASLDRIAEIRAAHADACRTLNRPPHAAEPTR